jgi:hypothetical protein
VLHRVAAEVNLYALGQQTLTASAAAAAQDVTASGRLGACTEAKLLLARPLGWLVGPVAHRRGWEKES